MGRPISEVSKVRVRGVGGPRLDAALMASSGGTPSQFASRSRAVRGSPPGVTEGHGAGRMVLGERRCTVVLRTEKRKVDSSILSLTTQSDQHKRCQKGRSGSVWVCLRLRFRPESGG